MAERKNVNNGDWDAKGDLLAGTANDAFDQVAVGANNTILTADSTVSTGMKWAAPATPSGVVLVSDFDAKGDLLVGTANDAFDQLPVGATNGDVLTAASGETTGLKYSPPPGREIGYAEITANSVITATVDPGDIVVSLGALTYTAVPTLIEFFYSTMNVNGSTLAQLQLCDGTTVLNIATRYTVATGVEYQGGVLGFRFTPAAGSHTYNIRGKRTGGTSITVRAAAFAAGANFAPAWIRATIA